MGSHFYGICKAKWVYLLIGIFHLTREVFSFRCWLKQKRWVMLLHSSVWMRSEENNVSSGQYTSITFLGLTQNEVYLFSIFYINEKCVPSSLMFLFLLWWVILLPTEQSPQKNVKIHIIVHSILTDPSAERGDCCEKQCMTGFCRSNPALGAASEAAVLAPRTLWITLCAYRKSRTGLGWSLTCEIIMMAE